MIDHTGIGVANVGRSAGERNLGGVDRSRSVSGTNGPAIGEFALTGPIFLSWPRLKPAP
jgi:hypothetical protein